MVLQYSLLSQQNFMLKTYLLKRQFFLSNNQMNIKEHFEFVRQIGRGAYGVVYEAKQRYFPYQVRVIKRIHKKKIKNPTGIYSQVHIMSRIDHPHIIKLYDTYEDEQNLFFVMDICSGGQLYEKLSNVNTFNEQNARIVFKQMVSSIRYLHKLKITHRDLKLQNFMMKNRETWEISLIDFGLSFEWTRNMKEEMIKCNQMKIIGTAYYIAPEVLKKNYDERCDIWSLGVVLYMMVTGTPPFDGENEEGIFKAIGNFEYSLNTHECQILSLQLRDLISRMLQPEDLRISLQEIETHPWMTVPINESFKKPLNLKIDNLVKYLKFSKLKKIVSTYIATHLSEKQIGQIRVLFEAIDTNDDGFISLEQLATYLGQTTQTNYDDLKQLLTAIDCDNNGLINYNQFISSCIEELYVKNKEYIRFAFNSFDLNRDGKIQREEFTLVLRAFAKDFKCNQELVNNLLMQNDKNHDGVIDYYEFQQSLLALRAM